MLYVFYFFINFFAILYVRFWPPEVEVLVGSGGRPWKNIVVALQPHPTSVHREPRRRGPKSSSSTPQPWASANNEGALSEILVFNNQIAQVHLPVSQKMPSLEAAVTVPKY